MWKKPGLLFLLSLLVGLFIGLFVIAWWLFPGTWKDATLDDLRADLKIDYVRLVASSYAYRPDAGLALARLERLHEPQTALAEALAAAPEAERGPLLELQRTYLEAAAEKAALVAGAEAGVPAAWGSPYLGYGVVAFVILVLALPGLRWRRIRKNDAVLLWRVVGRRVVWAALLLMLYRFTTAIPITGINREAAGKAMEMTQGLHEGIGGALLAMDVLAGGTLSTFSILSIGIYAYILAGVLTMLMLPFVRPSAFYEPREQQAWLDRWTPWLSLLLSVPLGYLLLKLFSGTFAACLSGLHGAPAVQSGTGPLLGTLTVLAELAAAAKFAEWLTGRLSEVLRGQGPALVVSAGIAFQLLRTAGQVVRDSQAGLPGTLAFALLVVGLIVLTVYMLSGRRNVPIKFTRYAYRDSMNPSRSGGIRPQLPLMVGLAQATPVLHVAALLTLPVFFSLPLLCTGRPAWQALAVRLGGFLDASNPGYWLLFCLVLLPYTFWYTEVAFASQNYGENLRRSGALVPGLHTGRATENYLARITRRITLPFALYLVVLAASPFLLNRAFGLEVSPLLGVSIFVLVTTVRDALFYLGAELILHGYAEKPLLG